MSNKSICQKIADWFAPQTAPQPSFSVPKSRLEELEAFDWTPVVRKAEREISLQVEDDLKKYNEDLKGRKEAFKIEITSYRGNSIKIVREGQIDVIPIEDIRKVTFVDGHLPRSYQEYYRVNMDGITRVDPYGGMGRSSQNPRTYYFRAPYASPSSDDKVIISPVIEIYCPLGLGEEILNKIQEVMAE